MTRNVPKTLQNEIASIRRDWLHPYYGNRLANWDDTLMARAGAVGLKIYDDIERDTHAFAMLQKRKLAVIARPWEVAPASDAPRDQEVAAFIEAVLRVVDFDRLSVDLLDAVLKGFAVAEVLWAVDGQGRIVPRRIIARNQRRFVFDPDGNLRLLTMENLTDGELLPPRKFIVHSVGAKDGSPYGLGLGTRLYWPVLFKREGMSFWLVFADKFGSPTAVGKYPAGTAPDEQKKLLDALAAIAQDAGITMPDNMVVELLEASRPGSVDTYEKLLRYLDEAITVCVLGEMLTTHAKPAGIGGGAAQTQNEVRLELVKADADLLSATLNASLVAWLVELNFPGAAPPQVWRIVEEPQDLNARAERDERIARLGFKPTLDYITQTYGEGWEQAPEAPAPPPAGALPGAPRLPAAGAAADAPPPEFAESHAFPDQEALDALLAAWPAGDLRAQAAPMLAPVVAAMKNGASLAELSERLPELLPAVQVDALEGALARAMFVTEVGGRLVSRN